MNTNQTPNTVSPRRRTRIALAAGGAALLVAGAVTFGISARGDADADADAAYRDVLESRMQELVTAGYPGVLASVTAPDGTRTDVAVGEGELGSGTAPPTDGEVRVGSNTKMVVATIVLQLVQEGAIALDEPVDTYLPGLVTGDGIDGTTITVRDLLQHTSGLPETADQVAADAFGAQERYISPRDLLDLALTMPADFAPGERWAYSNTNYHVLGLVIEQVTQRALADQIDQRIAEPLGLEHTYLPAPGERQLRGEHPEGYHADVPGELREITDMDPSFGWAAGSLVSTPSELNTFMQALFGGELIDDESLALLQSTVPAPDPFHADTAYGLGVQSYELDCGGLAWGHGGDIPGTQTRNAVASDGTAVTIAVTALPWALVDQADEETLLQQYQVVIDALDETLCDD